MIQWFLRLFPQFQEALESRDRAQGDLSKALGELLRAREALQAANNDKLILQDRLESAIEDRTRLWELTRECISNERIAYQMQVNAEWQKHGFGAPYPDSPKLPNAFHAQGGGTEGRPQVQMPSTRVARATAQFIRETIDADDRNNKTP